MPLSTIDTYTFTILAYICVALLIAILILVIRINFKLASHSNKRTSPDDTSSRSSASDETESHIEVAPGTPFEEFLNENPERRSLSKKEQFAAYRDWRSAKGLNWK